MEATRDTRRVDLHLSGVRSDVGAHGFETSPYSAWWPVWDQFGFRDGRVRSCSLMMEPLAAVRIRHRPVLIAPEGE